ncbi:hypothetical protein C8Q78DRAFT_1075288 [Trametes maxima]|nr:hypothetical protein C8Q78DRAFT_1075288 [Trametes maxima]
MKRKRASRIVRSSHPDPIDPLSSNSTFGTIKTYTSKPYGTFGISRRREELAERYTKNILSLGTNERELLDELGASSHSNSGPGTQGDNDDMEIDVGYSADAAEWVDIEDDDEAATQIRDILSLRSGVFRAKDDRTWAHRVTNRDQNWEPLIPKLVNAFLQWRKGGLSVDDAAKDDTGNTITFPIDIIDFHTLHYEARIPASSQCGTRAEWLVLSGYLGTTPIQPSLAISLKTLELFRSIRLFKASFSVEAFARLICHYYSMPYRRTYRTALSDAFDIYLRIMRDVEAGVSRALGRDTPNWRALNACPPCGYKLQDEPSLLYGRLYAMDGNNSLKRLAPLGGRKVGDDRTFDDSDYFLSKETVDKYANEVRSRPTVKSPDDGESDDNDNDDDPGLAAAAAKATESEGGDPTDGSGVVSSCTKNWKAAAAEEKKRAWGIFEETGIFASACRHGLVLWLVDMVRSGELAKYPLAIVAKMLETLNEPTLCGFDIGCTFEGTVKSSSLGPTFMKSGSRICVNAFHGYSHNYRCQLVNHPNILRGIGIKDLETMERIFSASNHLASIVRYASAYRRRVLIDAFFRQWDTEKYQNLGLMLYNNYRQALELIKSLTAELSQVLASLEIGVNELRVYRQEELQYFEELGEELPRDLHAIAYVEALEELNSVSAELDGAEEQFLKTVPPDYAPAVAFLPPTTALTTYSTDASATRKVETRRRFLRDRLAVLQLEVATLEIKLGIDIRWQAGDTQYVKVLDYIATRRYQRALGHLQRLVVQRLFELHRLNLSQTAYRVRTHIAKHLQARCRAIRNAVKTYNAAAAAMKPPRPSLDWSRVSHISFIEEFELLQDTRGDLQDKPWRLPQVREAMRIAHHIERAQEEIARVNIDLVGVGHVWQDCAQKSGKWKSGEAEL